MRMFIKDYKLFYSVYSAFQVSAVNKYDPSLEVTAARDHMTHLMYQHMQPQGIFDRCFRLK